MPDARAKHMYHVSKKMEEDRNYARKAMAENPWCASCTESDCVVSGDGTCAMIRKYLHNDNRPPVNCSKCGGDGYVVRIVRGPESQAGIAEDCECVSRQNAHAQAPASMSAVETETES